MAAFKTRKFQELEEVDLFLNGGLIGGADLIGLYLVGLTFKFVKPSAATVTFTASTDPNNPDPSRLSFKDIKEQIEAAIATVSVRQRSRHIVLIEKVPTDGVTVGRTGTANNLIGFDTAVDTVGTKFGPIGASAPSLQAYSANDNAHVVSVYL